MPRIDSIIHKFFLPVLLLPIIFAGCSVFSPIGDAISGGYDNTVSYFNLYYNARRAFSDAEAEILAAATAARGKNMPGSPQSTVSANAQKNLDLVIDKCSNILAYHPKSSLVDNALMLVGKAHYYRAEFSKAERKFSELISQYPGSEFLIEAHLWFARTQLKLGRKQDALKSADALIIAASEQGEDDIRSEAYFLIAAIHESQNAAERAMEFYEKAAEAADDDELKANAYAKGGDLYLAAGQYEKALDAFSRVRESSNDVYLLFQSKLQSSIAYRSLQRFDKALSLVGEITDNYMYKDYFGSALLERATILMASGRAEEAVDQYRALDTLYVRTEVGTKASYELGDYFERTNGDYSRAKDYFARAAAMPGLPVAAVSAKKLTALTSYFVYKNKLSIVDTLFRAGWDSVPSPKTPDRLALTDSLARKDTVVAAPVQRILISQDSLDNAVAQYAAVLGDLFYAELGNPDSAIYWLTVALGKKANKDKAPRILYTLTQLAESYPGKTPKTPAEYQDDLVRNFPRSFFARQIRGPSTALKDIESPSDSAEQEYAVAEGLLESGKYTLALDRLQKITTAYPSSPVSAKSQYAIGWVYEYKLGRPDTARVKYKSLLGRYPNSPYSRLVAARMLDTTAIQVASIDSNAVQSAPVIERRDTVRVKDIDDDDAALRERNAKRGLPPSRREQVNKQTEVKKED